MIYLASYPRSGNTYMRSVLWQCFGVRSGSVYRNDLGGDTNLAEKVGHLEHWTTPPEVVKTHRLSDLGARHVFYLVRHPFAVAASIMRFYDAPEEFAVMTVCEGTTEAAQDIIGCGSWSEHARAGMDCTWCCKYEHVQRLSQAIDTWRYVLDTPPIARKIDPANDGRWHSKNRASLSDSAKEAIRSACGSEMERLGYN